MKWPLYYKVRVEGREERAAVLHRLNCWPPPTYLLPLKSDTSSLGTHVIPRERKGMGRCHVFSMTEDPNFKGGAHC